MNYRIPTQFLPELTEKVAKMNRKAAKLGTDLITMTKVGPVERVETKVGGSIGRQTGGRLSYEVQPVEVVGHAPVINGWQFVAILRHRRTGNLFEMVHGANADQDELEARYIFQPKNCDHCHQNRVRNATYILQNTNNGEYMQVGSACLGDFTGYNDPQAAARACENIFKMFHTFEHYAREIPRTTKVFFLQEWMAFCAKQIRVNGRFVSRYEAGPNSTADQAKLEIIAFANGDDSVWAPDAEDWASAEHIIGWVRSLDPQDDFQRSLVAAMAADDDLREEDMGITAAAYKAYYKAEQERIKAEQQQGQGFIGTVGDRRVLTLTLETERMGDFGYGPCHIYNFTDGPNKVVWFTSKGGLQVGQTYTVQATIKSHDIDRYNGNKVTKIGGRVKVA